MPCEDCLSRRDFLATAAGAAGLIVLSGCGDGTIGAPFPSLIVIAVADFPGLANVGQLVKVGEVHAAKRTGAATFDAFSMRCTHQGCVIDIVSGQSFDCPCHRSRFANDGSVINGPNTGESIGPLVKLTTSYDPATDQLTIS